MPSLYISDFGAIKVKQANADPIHARLINPRPSG